MRCGASYHSLLLLWEVTNIIYNIWCFSHFSTSATFGAFSLGNVIAWPATAINGIKDEEDGIDIESTEAWIVSIFMIGAAIVPWIACELRFQLSEILKLSLFAAFAFNFIGKKWSLVGLSIPFIGGWLLLVFATNSAMLLIGRFITGSTWTIFMKFLNSLLGFAGGAFVLAAPAYSSEIAETKYRGILGTMMQLMVCVGILFINLNCETDWRG